ncbi:hypothetical protein [Herbaspirillum sp. C7C8]|uniref:hypothetical protein n=1 Tax=Herbaspirillum sp. C7C8 TaxID=2736665 RepID=UPI001F520F98|nr:hypothetical protein [Herbaspirillum sp. C7C8]MCI1005037.1 hypothetical protein [Herbaspirillum sp. C7C8]
MAKDQGFYLHFGGFDGFDKKIDFDRKEIRRAMRQSGRTVQQAARKLVAKSTRSQPGAYPGRRTGRLQRSIKLKVSRSGFLVRVAPQLTSDMKQFYPAFLHYGVRRKPGAKRKAEGKGSGSNRVEPRGNYMVDALNDRSEEVRRILQSAFAKALDIK